MLVHYLLQWPKVPEELYSEVNRIVETAADELPLFANMSYDPYKLLPIDGLLREWILSNIPIEFGPCLHIHVISSDLAVHKDFMKEKYKVNYIFETGGDSVETNFYDDDLKLLESNIVQQHCWHTFDGTINHAAEKLEKGKLRIAITLGTDTELGLNYIR